MAHDGSVGKVRVSVALSNLAFEGLMAGDGGSQVQGPVRLESALRCYLEDRGGGRPAWPYPSFLRAAETQADERVELDVDEDLWHHFEAEASAQEVSTDQLAEHAAFYVAAEMNAGRLTQRILEDLESGPGDKRD